MSKRMVKWSCGLLLAAFVMTFGTAMPARASWPGGALGANGDDEVSDTSRLVAYGLLGAVVVVLFVVAWQADRDMAGTRSMHARISELEGERASGGGLYGALRPDTLPEGMLADDHEKGATLEIGWRMTF